MEGWGSYGARVSEKVFTKNLNKKKYIFFFWDGGGGGGGRVSENPNLKRK